MNRTLKVAQVINGNGTIHRERTFTHARKRINRQGRTQRTHFTRGERAIPNVAVVHLHAVCNDIVAGIAITCTNLEAWIFGEDKGCENGASRRDAINIKCHLCGGDGFGDDIFSALAFRHIHIDIVVNRNHKEMPVLGERIRGVAGIHGGDIVRIIANHFNGVAALAES